MTLACVQVGQVEYDAVTNCGGADAWTCLARTVEESSYARKLGGGGGGWHGDHGDEADFFHDRYDNDPDIEDAGSGGDEGGLEQRLMRCAIDTPAGPL